MWQNKDESTARDFQYWEGSNNEIRYNGREPTGNIERVRTLSHVLTLSIVRTAGFEDPTHFVWRKLCKVSRIRLGYLTSTIFFTSTYRFPSATDTASIR